MKANFTELRGLQRAFFCQLEKDNICRVLGAENLNTNSSEAKVMDAVKDVLMSAMRCFATAQRGEIAFLMVCRFEACFVGVRVIRMSEPREVSI